MRDSFFARDLHAQPGVVASVIAEERAGLAQFAAVARRRARCAVLVGRGSSANVALYGKYLLETRSGLAASLAAPSVYTRYQRPPCLDSALVIAVSQSGQTLDVNEVLAEASRQGALTLAVTNDLRSPLAQLADYVVNCHAGEEGMAATKTYLGTLAALALLADVLSDAPAADALAVVPEAVAATLEAEMPAMELAAEAWLAYGHGFVLGRGYNTATASETALKLKELAAVHAEALSAAEFRHGPMALVEPGLPALLIAPGPTTGPDMAELASTLRQRGAWLAIVASDETILAQADFPLRLPIALPEWLTPLTAVIPGQRLAGLLAEAKGLDPDHPRAVSKVTLTW